jgi:hypothetical protein
MAKVKKKSERMRESEESLKSEADKIASMISELRIKISSKREANFNKLSALKRDRARILTELADRR